MNVDVTLAHAQRMAREIVLQSERRAGRLSLKDRKDLDRYQATITLCEEVLRLRAIILTMHPEFIV